MKILTTGIMILAALMLNSCEEIITQGNCIEGEGEIVEQIISVDNFTGVNLMGAHNIFIKQGPIQEVLAVGHENIIEKIGTKVENGIWKSGLKTGCYQNYDLTIYITTNDINEIQISGAGNITLEDFTNQSDLKAEISGSGNIVINQFSGTRHFDVSISGSGSVQVKNNFPDIENLNVSISGSGDFKGYPLTTENCSTKISGIGNSYVSVSDRLSVAITGIGNVYYKGHPDIDMDIRGIGKIISAN